jgi:hypothetical protein
MTTLRSKPIGARGGLKVWLKRSSAGAAGLAPRAPGSATRASYAGRTPAGATANPKLTFQPDHSIGAGQVAADDIDKRQHSTHCSRRFDVGTEQLLPGRRA